MLDIELAPTAPYGLEGIILGGFKDLKGRMLILVLLLLRSPLCPVVAQPPRIRLVVQLVDIDLGGVNLRVTEFTD
jgi:hypothetical protein